MYSEQYKQKKAGLFFFFGLIRMSYFENQDPKIHFKTNYIYLFLRFNLIIPNTFLFLKLYTFTFRINSQELYIKRPAFINSIEKYPSFFFFPFSLTKKSIQLLPPNLTMSTKKLVKKISIATANLLGF